MLSPYEQKLVETISHNSGTFSQRYLELCGQLQIPGGPPWDKLRTTGLKRLKAKLKR